MSQIVIVVVVVVLVLVLLLNINKKDNYSYEDGYEYRDHLSKRCQMCLLAHQDDPKSCVNSCVEVDSNAACVNCLTISENSKTCIPLCVRPK